VDIINAGATDPIASGIYQAGKRQACPQAEQRTVAHFPRFLMSENPRILSVTDLSKKSPFIPSPNRNLT
jgi:hypothetical protein